MTTLVFLLLAYTAYLLFMVSLCKAAAAGDRVVIVPRPPPVQLSFSQTDPGWVFGFAEVAEPAGPAPLPVASRT